MFYYTVTVPQTPGTQYRINHVVLLLKLPDYCILRKLRNRTNNDEAHQDINQPTLQEVAQERFV